MCMFTYTHYVHVVSVTKITLFADVKSFAVSTTVFCRGDPWLREVLMGVLWFMVFAFVFCSFASRVTATTLKLLYKLTFR
jgi:hypothetical protein